MDFVALNTRKAADEGAFLHLRHPVTEELLWTEEGEAVGLMVRGTEGDRVQQKLRDIEKRMKNEDDAKRGLAFLSSLVFEFVNVTYEGRPLKDNDADKELFFRLSDSFVDQTVVFARKRASFFGKSERKNSAA